MTPILTPFVRLHAAFAGATTGHGRQTTAPDAATILRPSLERRQANPASEIWVPGSPASAESLGLAGVSSEADRLEQERTGRSVTTLSWGAKVFVSTVIMAGAAVAWSSLPKAIPDPGLSVGLLALVIATSLLKVKLPVANTSATMSVSFVADFLALLVVGPQQAVVMAGIGAVAQCLGNRSSRSIKLYRVVFSAATLIITMQVTAYVYALLGGQPGAIEPKDIAKPIVGGAMAYFLCNTILVATAGALATRRSPFKIWYDAFLWSAPSYFVGGGVAAASSWLIGRGEAWFAPIVAAPAYLTYLTYKVYLGRIEDQRQHVEEISAMHDQAMLALDYARRSEHALAIEKERLGVTLASIGEAVIATDTKSRIVLMNRSAEMFTGWTAEDATGRPVMDVVQLVDRASGRSYASPVDKVLRTQQSVEHEVGAALIARDGHQRLVDLSAMPIHDADGTLVAVALVALDMTDALRLEEERLRASKLASLGVLAGGIAHDFNNILTAIVGNISLAQMEAGSAALHGSLNEAERACARAKSLTQQLLTFSKGGAPVRKTVFLSDVIRDTTSFSLRGSNVRCELDVPADLWAADADEGQLVQVLNNLLINAAQAMPSGGVVWVKASNVPGAEGAGRPEVVIEVRDGGVGIPEENLGRIFDPYFTTKKSGNGLGLATSYSIVRNHGGRIDVQSSVGHGTTMIVVLPANTSARRPADVDAKAPSTCGKGRVLVMDDEPQIRSLARQMLGRLGYRVEVVADGRTAIDVYKEAKASGDRFDVVIMDLTVPGGMGGKDAVKAILETDPAAVAIVSSGYADDPVMADFGRYGFKGVVPKPFTMAELSKLVHELVG